ncbi:MAG: metal-dependent hydrolase [Gemmatimonadales bacterium]
MASAPTHIVATSAIAAFFHRPAVRWHLWAWGAALAIAPDLDVIGFRLGVAYGDMLGHRGLSHSLVAAVVVSGLVVASVYRQGAGVLTWKQAWLFLFLAMASHGFLDAFTNGGLGIAFFAPFSAERYFFPFRPIDVSPLSIRRFLSSGGVGILLNEMLWVWLPSLVIAASVFSYRRFRSRSDTAIGRVY